MIYEKSKKCKILCEDDGHHAVLVGAVGGRRPGDQQPHCAVRADTYGREMYAAKIYLQTANLFAWTIVVILSLLFERIFMLLLNKCNSIKGEGAKKMMMKNKMRV